MLTDNSDFIPTENVDPGTILVQARADVRNGLHANAFAKYYWLFCHGHKLRPSFSAARTSYVVREWYELGISYPRAAEEMAALLQRSKVRVLECDQNRAAEHFNDIASINRVLGKPSETAEFFLTLSDHNPSNAKEAFFYAMPYLVAAKEYRVCSGFLEHQRNLRCCKELMRIRRQFAADGQFGLRFKEYNDQKASECIATLIALLVFNGRCDEAGEIAENVKSEWTDTMFHLTCNQALEGVFPQSPTSTGP